MDSVNWFYGFGLGREEMELVKWWKIWGKWGGFVKAGIEQWGRKKEQEGTRQEEEEVGISAKCHEKSGEKGGIEKN